MYLIVVYDLRAKRTRLLREPLRKYLNHVQNSVFEGEVTEGEIADIEHVIENTVKHPDESVILYKLGTESVLNRTVYGEDPAENSQIL